MQEELREHINEALQALSLEAKSFEVEYPHEISHGDYATNVALIAAGSTKEKPLDLAKRIADFLKEKKYPEIERIEVAGPGFINFFLSRSFFTGVLNEIAKLGADYGKNLTLSSKKVIVEYTDPNLFKTLHIGHLMSNAIGEALSRIIQWNGATVKRANYMSDVGINIAKAVWGIQKLEREKPDALSAEAAALSDRAAFLAQAYVTGAQAFESDPAVQAEIKELNKKIYERSDEHINQIYDEGRKISLESLEQMFKRLGTSFDFYFFESVTGKLGEKLVREWSEKGVFEKSDGAYIFPGEQYGLHTRVFINSQGLPTYEAKELGLAKYKYDEFSYDESLVITANEINDYFKVLLKALSFVYPELAEKTKHLSHGVMRLPEGKMSSRTGKVVAAEPLLNELYDRAFARMEGQDMPENERDRVADMVAVAAVKYSILKQGIGRDIVFDMEKSLSFEGDSGPYIQYTRARAHSVVARAQRDGFHVSSQKAPQEVAPFERLLHRFPELVARAYRERAPQLIAAYLADLAGSFNTYYATTRIVEEDEFVSYRLALAESLSTILANGLSVLGIQAPERM